MNPTSVSERQTSRTRSRNVSMRTWTRPCAPRWSCAMPNGIGGPTSASSSGAARFATSSGMYTSVHSGPWSPWSSVEPTGTITLPAARLQVLAHLEVRHLRHEDRRGHPAASLREPERGQVLVRAAHRRVDVGERRPRLALELDLHGERAVVPGVAQDLEHAREVDDAVTGARGSSSCPCRPSCPSGGRCARYGVIFGRSSTALSPE